jgi:1-acyl-sn-glycerol-3-phosphate acyltransferase
MGVGSWENKYVSLNKVSCDFSRSIPPLGKLDVSHTTTAMTRADITTTNSTEIHSTQTIRSGFSPWLTKIIYPLGRYIVLPGFFREIEIIGQEHIPYTGAVILAPTHRTRWDSLLVSYAVGPYVTGRNLRVMVTRPEMQGIQGWFLRRLGCFPIDTTKLGIGSIRHSVELLHQGEMLTIYPEGNLFRDGKLHPLKKGLARIAMQSVSLQPDLDLKIIPICLDYEDLTPKFRDRVTVKIGKPLPVQAYQHLSSKAAAEQLHQDLTRSLEGLTQGESIDHD